VNGGLRPLKIDDTEGVTAGPWRGFAAGKKGSKWALASTITGKGTFESVQKPLSQMMLGLALQIKECTGVF